MKSKRARPINSATYKDHVKGIRAASRNGFVNIESTDEIRLRDASTRTRNGFARVDCRQGSACNRAEMKWCTCNKRGESKRRAPDRNNETLSV